MLAHGLRPSNTEQGYVLRRLIRRAIREADRLGIKEAILPEVTKGYASAYQEQYPLIAEQADAIHNALEKEEEQFRKTLSQGLKEFENITRYPEKVSELILGVEAFNLFTTFGFPFELTKELAAEKGIIVNDTQFNEKMKEHQEKSRAGAAQKFAGGLADHAEQTVRYHTAHHLLLKALQMVLGPDVHQRGSNITSERLRIDFSYGQKMTPEQIAEVEKIVNEKIAEEIPVIRTDMKKEAAEKLGAEHEFGVKYPDTVSVYSVGSLDTAFSIEFCGGPHVENTRELASVRDPDGSVRKGVLKFKILKEEASSAGVRRIKAVLV
jgi:alanyl-tRNA synthetase